MSTSSLLPLSRQRWLATVGLAFTLVGLGCAPKATRGFVGSVTGSNLAPRPSDADSANISERSQLLRYRGQTRFLNPIEIMRGPMRSSKAESPSAGTQDQSRAEQESDVYKIGKPGSKLLYLLNRYRGLQVVSFADGAESAKLLGRAAPTGNSPSEMYFDADRDRLIVLESLWDAQTSESKSGLVLYDVKNPAAPFLAGRIEIAGSIADSRIVGNVLYVATSNGTKGAITSFSLSRKDLKQVDTRVLQMPVSSSQNMSIQNVTKDGKTKYYLVATLSESTWSWWDRASVIEIVDISDVKGKILPVMSVATKGVVRERSQTLIKNETLIVTSNYFLGQPNDRRTQIGRIAVETFRFPTDVSEVITENEATFRKLNIDRQLQTVSGTARDELFEKLANDPLVGIKGRFVRAEGGELKKILADSIVTVGDGSGLSANLQDVRYQDGLLYAFWVPANEMDPFDLFDISEPEKGVRYLSRLQFDGWIQRAVPVSVGGRKFVIGLGWIVPVINNEERRRQPQAMVFEVMESRGKLRAVDIAQLSFEGSNIWSNFQGQDKEIEVRVDAGGKGEILFQASRWDSHAFSEGGQTVRFDLGQVLKEQYTNVIKQGPFLSGGSDWVKRVFTNTEIGRVNSFSDRALATFSSEASDGSTITPVQILELARNLRGYETLRAGEKLFGVQMISNDNNTELRSVAANRADEEKAGVLSSVTLPGGYLAELKEAKTGDVLVMTGGYESRTKPNGSVDYFMKATLSRISAGSDGVLKVVAQASWTDGDQASVSTVARMAKMSMPRFPYRYHNSNSLTQLPSGMILSSAGNSTVVVDLTSGLSVNLLTMKNCVTADRTGIAVKVLGGKAFLASQETFESKEFEGIMLERNFVAPLTLSAAASGHEATCGSDLNIPGEALTVTGSGEILTRDHSAKDIMPVKVDEPNNRQPGDEPPAVRYQVLAKNALVSLKIQNAAASLVDETVTDDLLSNALEATPGTFVRLTKSERWGASSHEFEFVSLASDGTLTSQTFGVQLKLEGTALLRNVSPDPRVKGQFVALVSADDQVQALRFSSEDQRPQIALLSPVNERFEKLKGREVVHVPLNGYGYNPAHFTPESLSFELVNGDAGLTQVYLAD